MRFFAVCLVEALCAYFSWLGVACLRDVRRYHWTGSNRLIGIGAGVSMIVVGIGSAIWVGVSA
jgi:hypothetical protein